MRHGHVLGLVSPFLPVVWNVLNSGGVVFCLVLSESLSVAHSCGNHFVELLIILNVVFDFFLDTLGSLSLLEFMISFQDFNTVFDQNFSVFFCEFFEPCFILFVPFFDHFIRDSDTRSWWVSIVITSTEMTFVSVTWHVCLFTFSKSLSIFGHFLSQCLNPSHEFFIFHSSLSGLHIWHNIMNCLFCFICHGTIFIRFKGSFDAFIEIIETSGFTPGF